VPIAVPITVPIVIGLIPIVIGIPTLVIVSVRHLAGMVMMTSRCRRDREKAGCEQYRKEAR
jgi:hypothetical protein